MGKLPFWIKVILSAFKPISKTADISDWRDILQIVLVALGYGGGGILMELITFDWVKISYFAFVPALLFFIVALKLSKSVDAFESKVTMYHIWAR